MRARADNKLAASSSSVKMWARRPTCGAVQQETMSWHRWIRLKHTHTDSHTFTHVLTQTHTHTQNRLVEAGDNPAAGPAAAQGR